MDLEKLLAFVTANVAEYYMVFAATLAKPTVRFYPLEIHAHSSSTHGQILISKESVVTGPRLNAKLLSFVVISLFIGITINQLIPNRIEGPDITGAIVIITGLWLIYSSILHWVCKVLGGRGSYLDTMSISIQVLSVLFVLSSFVTLLIASVLQIKQINDWGLNSGGFVSHIIEHPFTTFFLTQFLLLIVYLPLATRNVHRFNWLRTVIIAIFAPVFTAFSIILYASFGLK